MTTENSDNNTNDMICNEGLDTEVVCNEGLDTEVVCNEGLDTEVVCNEGLAAEVAPTYADFLVRNAERNFAYEDHLPDIDDARDNVIGAPPKTPTVAACCTEQSIAYEDSLLEGLATEVFCNEGLDTEVVCNEGLDTEVVCNEGLDNDVEGLAAEVMCNEGLAAEVKDWSPAEVKDWSPAEVKAQITDWSPGDDCVCWHHQSPNEVDNTIALFNPYYAICLFILMCSIICIIYHNIIYNCKPYHIYQGFSPYHNIPILDICRF